MFCLNIKYKRFIIVKIKTIKMYVSNFEWYSCHWCLFLLFGYEGSPANGICWETWSSASVLGEVLETQDHRVHLDETVHWGQVFGLPCPYPLPQCLFLVSFCQGVNSLLPHSLILLSLSHLPLGCLCQVSFNTAEKKKDFCNADKLDWNWISW